MLSEDFKQYAISKHKEVNQTYDGHCYSLHLSLVAAQAAKWFYIIYPKITSDIREIVIGAAWCHDIIEDTHETFNDLCKATCDVVEPKDNLLGNIVYAVTNLKGRNRSERANSFYYKGIREQQYASFVKLCDRLGNGYYSKATNSRQFKMYQKEHHNFIQQLCNYEDRILLQPMIDELEILFEIPQPEIGI